MLHGIDKYMVWDTTSLDYYTEELKHYSFNWFLEICWATAFFLAPTTSSPLLNPFLGSLLHRNVKIFKTRPWIYLPLTQILTYALFYSHTTLLFFLFNNTLKNNILFWCRYPFSSTIPKTNTHWKPFKCALNLSSLSCPPVKWFG